MRTKSGRLFLLLVVLQCLFAVQEAFTSTPITSSSASNLFRRSTTMSSPPSASGVGASIRGGGNASGKGDNKNEKQEKPKSIEEVQEEALGTISNCYRMAFTAGVVGTASVLRESYKRSDAAFGLNLAEGAKLLNCLFAFVFGIGLVQARQIFQQSRGVDRMSPPNLLKLCQTLSRLWMIAIINLSLDGIAMSSELKVHKAVAIATFLFVGNLPLGQWFHRTSLDKEDLPEAAAEYVPARKVGLSAARNMVCTVGCIALSALVEQVGFAIKGFQAESRGDKIGVAIGGLLTLSESVAIGGLLASLYRTLLRAVLTSTKRSFNSKDPSFEEYYQAQTKFYGRLASFFGFQAFFAVLGFVAPLISS